MRKGWGRSIFKHVWIERWQCTFTMCFTAASWRFCVNFQEIGFPAVDCWLRVAEAAFRSKVGFDLHFGQPSSRPERRDVVSFPGFCAQLGRTWGGLGWVTAEEGRKSIIGTMYQYEMGINIARLDMIGRKIMMQGALKEKNTLLL